MALLSLEDLGHCGGGGLDTYTGELYCWDFLWKKVARGEINSPDNHLSVSSCWICAATKGSGITSWGDGRRQPAQWAPQGGSRPRADQRQFNWWWWRGQMIRGDDLEERNKEKRKEEAEPGRNKN